MHGVCVQCILLYNVLFNVHQSQPLTDLIKRLTDELKTHFSEHSTHTILKIRWWKSSINMKFHSVLSQMHQIFERKKWKMLFMFTDFMNRKVFRSGYWLLSLKHRQISAIRFFFLLLSFAIDSDHRPKHRKCEIRNFLFDKSFIKTLFMIFVTCWQLLFQTHLMWRESMGFSSKKRNFSKYFMECNANTFWGFRPNVCRLHTCNDNIYYCIVVGRKMIYHTVGVFYHY